MQAAMQREKSWRTPSHLMAIKEGFSLPTTPSKSKLPGRRGFCSFTTLLVLFALLAGIAMFNQDFGSGSSHTETYYRKALVAKMTFSQNGQTVTATSEEYSHSTVAAAGGAAGGKAAASAAAAGKAGATEMQQRGALEIPLDEDDEAVLMPDGDNTDTDEDGAEEEGYEEQEAATAASKQPADGSSSSAAATATTVTEEQHLVTTVTSSKDKPVTVTISTTRTGSTQQAAQQKVAAAAASGDAPAASKPQQQAEAAAAAPAKAQQAAAPTTEPAATDAAAADEVQPAAAADSGDKAQPAADAAAAGATTGDKPAEGEPEGAAAAPADKAQPAATSAAATSAATTAAGAAEPEGADAAAGAAAAAAAAAKPGANVAAAKPAVITDEDGVEVAPPVKLQSEDLAADGSTLEQQWWSDVVGPSGERLAKSQKKERDISASLKTAVTFDESQVGELSDCKIAVLDVDKEWGKKLGAGNCNLNNPKIWPFAAAGKGIDGHDSLSPEQYQYSMEHWIAQAIRNSSRYTNDLSIADFVFVDMHCYHMSWMAWLHPLNAEGRKVAPNPEGFIRRAISRLQGMPRFRDTKGGDFGLVQPAPLMKGMFSEEAACEDLASVLNMVPERSALCVWTQDSHAAGKSVLLPYAAVSDIDLEAPVVPAADRETFLFFQGGCGSPDPAVRQHFAAGKMLRYSLVQELKSMNQADIHAECACDICDGHMPHDQLTSRMSRSVFCPIMPSNTQSSRRLSEAMLTGCIPVFIGAPFHTLPLASDIDYKSFAVFINVSDSSAWVNSTSPKWEHNHMISKAWKLDDASSAGAIVTVPRLADIVRFLRGMPAEEVAARQAGVIANRLKFYYPAASAQAIAASVAATSLANSAAAAAGSTLGSILSAQPDSAAAGGAAAATATPAAKSAAGLEPAPQPGSSVLGELLMRKMCRRAAAVQKRLEEAAQQGMDLVDSDEKFEHPTLVIQAAAEQQQQQAAGDAAAAAAGAAKSSKKKARNTKRHLLAPFS